MKIIRFVVFMFVTASTYAQEPLSDEKQILKLEDDWVRALETKDWKLLDMIVARDFTFIEPDGTVKNRGEYLADRSSDSADIESFENVDLKARVFGNCALASGIAKITERRQGKHYRFSLRWKELWLKDKGKWHVLVSQATPVNPNWDASFVIKE
jgi:ketosteroid isomerase-like protein